VCHAADSARAARDHTHIDKTLMIYLISPPYQDLNQSPSNH
jgi:hypothetical protein